ncbi:MAG: anthranilate phosphoribosyltransferase [Calditrichia bacterium]|nr:anthranilate phosphoribosyltransferase [Calditrichia bacterium]
MLKPYLEKITAGEDLSRQEASEALNVIITGDLSGAEVGGLLVGLRVKGESVEEISGFVDTMQEHMVNVDLADKNAIDVCGTGGDGTHSFNVSTTCALVAAAGGVTVAKHGNRSVSSKSGSADLLEALGVKIDLTPEKTKKCIDEIRIGFFFAPNYHPAMKAVMPHRKSLGIRTVFNMLGPLLNPARVKRQLIGTFDLQTAEKLAGVLQSQKYDKACTVHSEDGYDELSPFSSNFVFEIGSETDNINQFTYKLAKVADRNAEEFVEGADSKTNAEITLQVFDGKKGSARDMTVLNAAFALYVAGKTQTIENGIELAENTLDSGKARQKLDEFVEFSNS